MRILVVDDDEDGRDVAEAMLHAAGYEHVSAVGSVMEAYQLLSIEGDETQQRAPFDILLLDIVMPDIDGIQACARIRCEPRYFDLPILMITSLADMNSLANAFVAGATDYVTKPLNRVELHARVRSALKLKSEIDRRQARERELLTSRSSWRDNRVGHLIDDVTGLFVNEVAEAYLKAGTHFSCEGDISVIALTIDRLEAYRATRGEAAAAGVLARIGREVRATAATVGVLAAAYRDGTIVLIVPELPPRSALELAEELRRSISKLRITNREAICADHFTASIALITGRPKNIDDRVGLLTRAISVMPLAVAAGGNRVVPEFEVARLEYVQKGEHRRSS